MGRDLHFYPKLLFQVSEIKYISNFPKQNNEHGTKTIV